MDEEKTLRLRATVTLRNEKMIQARAASGLTQLDVAHFANVPYDTVKRLECLDFSVSPSELRQRAERIAKVLKLTADDILPEPLVGAVVPSKMVTTHDVAVEHILAAVDTRERHLSLPPAEQQMIAQEVIERLKTVVKRLPLRHQEVIELRFGLGKNRTHTLDEIAHKYRISRDAVRQMEARAISKLQRPQQVNTLLEAISGEVHYPQETNHCEGEEDG
jgi:RNA polymerase sigma factor (sigma-70 family)